MVCDVGDGALPQVVFDLADDISESGMQEYEDDWTNVRTSAHHVDPDHVVSVAASPGEPEAEVPQVLPHEGAVCDAADWSCDRTAPVALAPSVPEGCVPGLRGELDEQAAVAPPASRPFVHPDVFKVQEFLSEAVLPDELVAEVPQVLPHVGGACVAADWSCDRTAADAFAPLVPTGSVTLNHDQNHRQKVHDTIFPIKDIEFTNSMAAQSPGSASIGPLVSEGRLPRGDDLMSSSHVSDLHVDAVNSASVFD